MSEGQSTSNLPNGTHTSIEHWTIYGRPHDPQPTRVILREGQVKPFSEPQTIPWRIALDPASLRKLFLGFRPAMMEDRWFVFATDPDPQGNIRVNMYRSWTGYKIVELEIEAPGEEDPETTFITALTWEGDEEFYRSNGENDVKEMVRRVCRAVLGVTLGPEET